MKTRSSLFPALGATALLTLGIASSSEAAILLTIDEFTTTTFTVTISGTLDVPADSPDGSIPGNHPGIFAVTLNQGASIPFYSGVPLKTSGDLTWGPIPLPFQELMADPSYGRYAMFFSYDSTFPFFATSISGTVTFTGNFNPAAAQPTDFQLWSGSGESVPGGGHAIFHAQAVPEPSATALAGIAALGLLRRRR